MNWHHRVAMNCDLMFDVVTDSANTPIEELERLAKPLLLAASD
jgi:hypothetical protein